MTRIRNFSQHYGNITRIVKVDRPHYILLGVWIGNCDSNGVYCTSLRIVAITEMIDVEIFKERLSQLVQLEEERFIAGYH